MVCRTLILSLMIVSSLSMHGMEESIAPLAPETKLAGWVWVIGMTAMGLCGTSVFAHEARDTGNKSAVVLAVSWTGLCAAAIATFPYLLAGEAADPAIISNTIQ